MVGRLHEKVALVVGAGSVGPGWGNGKAAAVLFAREGARVLCADVNEDAANETVQIIRQENGTANAICADVRAARSLMFTCQYRFGGCYWSYRYYCSYRHYWSHKLQYYL